MISRDQDGFIILLLISVPEKHLLKSCFYSVHNYAWISHIKLSTMAVGDSETCNGGEITPNQLYQKIK